MSYHSRLATEARIIEQRIVDGDTYFIMKCLKVMVEKGKASASHNPYLTKMYNQYLRARKLHRKIEWFVPDFQLGRLSTVLKQYKGQLAELMTKQKPQQSEHEQLKMW